MMEGSESSNECALVVVVCYCDIECGIKSLSTG